MPQVGTGQAMPGRIGHTGGDVLPGEGGIAQRPRVPVNHLEMRRRLARRLRERDRPHRVHRQDDVPHVDARLELGVRGCHPLIAVPRAALPFLVLEERHVLRCPLPQRAPLVEHVLFVEGRHAPVHLQRRDQEP